MRASEQSVMLSAISCRGVELLMPVSCKCNLCLLLMLPKRSVTEVQMARLSAGIVCEKSLAQDSVIQISFSRAAVQNRGSERDRRQEKE